MCYNYHRGIVMRCEECGTKIKKNYKLCSNCGREVIF